MRVPVTMRVLMLMLVAHARGRGRGRDVLYVPSGSNSFNAQMSACATAQGKKRAPIKL